MPPLTSPNVSLYSLGRGIMSVAPITNGVAGAYVDVGNCPKFTVEVTEKTLEHFSSRTGLKTKDKQVILETGYTLAFSLDEISIQNLKMLLKGTLSAGHVILANTVSDQEWAIKFVSDNPVGENQTWEFWRVKLSPGGAFSLIGDDWTTLSYSGEGLADTSGHPTSPYFSVTFDTTTSSTTTTTTAP